MSKHIDVSSSLQLQWNLQLYSSETYTVESSTSQRFYELKTHAASHIILWSHVWLLIFITNSQRTFLVTGQYQSWFIAQLREALNIVLCWCFWLKAFHYFKRKNTETFRNKNPKRVEENQLLGGREDIRTKPPYIEQRAKRKKQSESDQIPYQQWKTRD